MRSSVRLASKPTFVLHTEPVGRTAVGAIVLGVFATALCACSSGAQVDEDHPASGVRTTQFANPPAPILDVEPTADELSILYGASTDYSIREEDRALLIEGDRLQNLALAREWGAQPSPQRIEFTVVELVDPTLLEASGHGRFGTVGPYPVGPIPFVRSDGQWKMSRSFVCAFVSRFGATNACQ